jgi:superfamily I DNA and/or RNA helicase
MNVALTRARASLFVLGHCPTLERSDKTWKDIISDARERGCLVEVGVFEAHSDGDVVTRLSRPTLTFS